MLGICTTIPYYTYARNPPLRLLYEWKQLEFDYASDVERQQDIDSGFFVEGVPAPIDVDIYYGSTYQIFFNDIFHTAYSKF